MFLWSIIFVCGLLVAKILIQDEGVSNPGLNASRCPSDHCCYYKICPSASNSQSRNSEKNKTGYDNFHGLAVVGYRKELGFGA